MTVFTFWILIAKCFKIYCELEFSDLFYLYVLQLIFDEVSRYRKRQFFNVFSLENWLNAFNTFDDYTTYETNKPSIYTDLFRISFNKKHVTYQLVLMMISHGPRQITRMRSRWENIWLLVDGLLTVWVSSWMLYSLHSCSAVRWTRHGTHNSAVCLQSAIVSLTTILSRDDKAQELGYRAPVFSAILSNLWKWNV